jgi:hypothetical protein
VCPGCGRRARLRGTPNVIVEWERTGDGRYIGYLVSPVVLQNFVYEIEYETDAGIAIGWGESDSVEPDSLPPEHLAMITKILEGPSPPESRSVWHECSHGDGGSDRAAVLPTPPPRGLAARLDPAERDA